MSKTSKFVELAKSADIRPQTIFDLGAFDAAQSVELAFNFPLAEVYAFEPVPQHGFMTEDCPRIHRIPVAVGDVTRVVKFNKSTGRNQECGSVLKPNGKYFEPMPTAEILVPMFRLETIILNLSIPGPELIWMDVQGNELPALHGLGLFCDRPQMIWTEVAYQAYYEGQMLAPEFDHAMQQLGFQKIFEAPGIPGWFGDACYQRK